MIDRVTQYANDVLNGKLIAGESVKLACRRHLDDFEKSKLAPFKYKFDIEKAEAIIDYANTLVINEGEEIINLTCYPFQEFILGSLIGWVNKGTEYRRFRTSYVQLGRQNGKSFINGILGTYLGNFSGYKNGKVFCVATKHAQAKIVWDEMHKFIKGDEDLQELFTVKEYESTIICNNTGTKILALGRDTKSLDGFRPAPLAIIDEFHAHKDEQMFKLMEGGQKKAKQSLISVITTAGFNIDGACHKMYKYCKQILEGLETNDNRFIYIAEMDEEDEKDNSENWIKANPILEYDREALENLIPVYKSAKAMGGKDWNDFQTKQLNMWVEFTEKKYMNMTAFYKCACDMTLEDFRGCEFGLGLDASSGGDLSSVVFEFTFEKDGEKKYFVHHHSFLPAMRIKEHEQTDAVPYEYWIKKSLVTKTTALGGIKIDYKEILKYVREQIRKYNLKLKYICYDQANVSAFLVDLEEFGVDCYDIYQNSKSLNDTTMDIKYEVEAGNIYFNRNDELLCWAMNNCELTPPKNGKVMLDKNSRFKRIDPIAAWVDVHKFSMRNEIKKPVVTAESIKSFFGTSENEG
jgi:phage terminase large subunit-like protein